MKPVLILGILLVGGINCDIFSAISNLLPLSENEEKVISETRDLLKDLKLLILKLERDLEIMEREHELMMENDVEYISNPLNALLLIKRLSVDVKQREEDVTKIGKKFLKNLKGHELPKEEFEGAIDGLARLQIYYDLKTEDLARGFIETEKTRNELTVEELKQIGDELAKSGNFIISLSYLNLSLYKNRVTKDIEEITILESIFHNYNNSGNIKAAIAIADDILTIDPSSIFYVKKIELEVEILFEDDNYESLDDEEDPFEKNGKYSDIKEFKFFADACNGKLKKSHEEISKLFCRYSSRSGHPSMIAPFKVEEANLFPFIAIVHDLITQSEADLFVKLSNPTMKRAKTMSKNSTETISNIRVAKHSWHPDESDKVFKTLSDRVADMTGLVVDSKTSEHWQTQNYGVGGYYKAHYDFTTKDSPPFSTGNGNRIATVLVYLSDVKREGATVFPFVSLKVPPKKGSAVFWWNLSTSGDGEYLTRHSGCPVLLGSKWVANKWIHEHGNEFKRPCELFPAETDEFFFKKFY